MHEHDHEQHPNWLRSPHRSSTLKLKSNLLLSIQLMFFHQQNENMGNIQSGSISLWGWNETCCNLWGLTNSPVSKRQNYHINTIISASLFIHSFTYLFLHNEKCFPLFLRGRFEWIFKKKNERWCADLHPRRFIILCCFIFSCLTRQRSFFEFLFSKKRHGFVCCCLFAAQQTFFLKSDAEFQQLWNPETILINWFYK